MMTTAMSGMSRGQTAKLKTIERYQTILFNNSGAVQTGRVLALITARFGTLAQTLKHS